MRTPRELIDAAQALLRCPPSRGRRVAVLGDGGGHVSIAAAVVAERGPSRCRSCPTRPRRRCATRSRRRPASRTRSIWPAPPSRTSHVFDRIALDLLGGGEVDALLVTGYFGGYAEYGPETAEPRSCAPPS